MKISLTQKVVDKLWSKRWLHMPLSLGFVDIPRACSTYIWDNAHQLCFSHQFSASRSTCGKGPWDLFSWHPWAWPLTFCICISASRFLKLGHNSLSGWCFHQFLFDIWFLVTLDGKKVLAFVPHNGFIDMQLAVSIKRISNMLQRWRILKLKYKQCIELKTQNGMKRLFKVCSFGWKMNWCDRIPTYLR